MRVVVLGGGIGGATAAKYLAMSGAPVSVTLIAASTLYTTGIFCNLYIAGARSLPSLTHGYEALIERYGVGLRIARAVRIDPEARHVRLQSGDKVLYDRLIISPGIAFEPNAIDGYNESAMALMPHAWTDSGQMELLRRQLEAMDDGGTLVIASPPDPYRCPVGPYERAALAAYYFKQFKPRSKILILDAKNSFPDQESFEEGWRRHYRDMIEWIPSTKSGTVTGVDPKSMAVLTASGTIRGDVVNVIPPQVAGALASTTGLTDRTGWCPIDPVTFESTLHRGVYVIGDAANAGAMPKTAFCANSQAKACVFALLAELGGVTRAKPHLLAASFAFLAGDDAMSDVSSFATRDRAIEVDHASSGHTSDNPDQRRSAVRYANRWYDDFMDDVLG